MKKKNNIATRKQHLIHYSLPMLICFFTSSYVLTWAFLIPALKPGSDYFSLFLIIPAAFGPFISAIIILIVFRGRKILLQWLKQVFNLHIPVILYLAGAFLFPLLIGVSHFLLYVVFGGKADFSQALPWYSYLLGLIPTALLTGGNEEPGWRGFALPGLLQRFHPIIATFILGIIHSAWHFPLMEHYQTTFLIYTFNVVGLTFLLNWYYLKSRKSVIPVMLLHAGTNVIGDFFPTPIVLLNGLGTYMVLRGIVYWVIAIALIVITKGRLGYDLLEGDPAMENRYESAPRISG